jgi:cell division protein FtsZ
MNRRYFLDALAALGAFTAVPALAGLDDKVFSANVPLRIGIVAIGGAGCSIVSNLRDKLPQATKTIAINTDATSLPDTLADVKVLVEGGPQASPDAARAQALGHEAAIAQALSPFELVFIVAGMGGSAGTGIAPLVAEVAKRTATLTVGVAVTPFSFEGDKRNSVAQQGVADLRGKVDAFFEISNERLTQSSGESVPFATLLRQADPAFIKVYTSTVEALTSSISSTKLV